MINLITSTFIERPVKQVFDFVSTPENDFRWHYGTLASSQLAEGIPAKGSFFRSFGHWMGRRNLSTFEVTEYKPNQKYGFKSLSGPLQSQTSYVFEIVEGNTKVTVSTQASLVNSLQVAEGILERQMRTQLNENLAVLKDVLEARRILPALETTSLAG